MSGLRAQLTSLRANSIDAASDLLAILGPMPVLSDETMPARSDYATSTPSGREVVTLTRAMPELSATPKEF